MKHVLSVLVENRPVVDVGKSSLTIEATGDDAKLRGLEDLLRAYGIKETVRTGKVALSRSSRD